MKAELLAWLGLIVGRPARKRATLHPGCLQQIESEKSVRSGTGIRFKLKLNS